MTKKSYILVKASIFLLLLVLAGCQGTHLGMLGAEDALAEAGNSNDESKNAEALPNSKANLLIESCGNAYQALYVALSEGDHETAMELLDMVIGFAKPKVSNFGCNDYGNSFGPESNLYASTILHLAVKAVKEGDLVGLGIISMLHMHWGRHMLNRPDYLGNTPIMLAVELGKVGIIQDLISNGANINTKNKFGFTAFEMAIKEKKYEIAKLLIGPIVKQAERNREPTLVYYAGFCSEAFATDLVNKGADINATDAAGRTALHFAAHGNLEMVAYLVLNSAYLDAKDATGKTPLHVAAYDGNIEIVNYLVEGSFNKNATINAEDRFGQTPLYAALRGGNIEVVNYLVSKGADINVTDDEGRNLLHAAIVWDNKKVAQELVIGTDFADVNGQDHRHGQTPLHAAIGKAFISKDEELVEFLVMQGGADLFVQDRRGFMPLHVMANVCSYALLEKVIAMLESKRVMQLYYLTKKFREDQYINFAAHMFRETLDYADLNPKLGIPTHEGKVFAELCRQRGFEDLAARAEALIKN